MIELWQGDCLELMKNIHDGSVDMILCDLPYGTTRCEWDVRIPFEPLWEQYNRIIKPNGAIVLFSAQPFTTDLINSQRNLFRYEIIWEKTQPTGFYNAKKMPLRRHENILVFYKKLPTYNPIKSKLSDEYIKSHLVPIGKTRKVSDWHFVAGGFVGTCSKEAAEKYSYTDDGTRYPTDIIKFSNWNGTLFGNKAKTVKHQTTKPVPILEYLIKTYTNEGDVVLDNCMGSGSTGVACINTNRSFIAIELNNNFYEIAKDRILEQLEKE